LEVSPRRRRVLAWPIELGSLSPGWGEADAASAGVGWLGDEWLLSELEIDTWVPPGKDAFVLSEWGG
jgi:hypothetical protein